MHDVQVTTDAERAAFASGKPQTSTIDDPGTNGGEFDPTKVRACVACLRGRLKKPELFGRLGVGVGVGGGVRRHRTSSTPAASLLARSLSQNEWADARVGSTTATVGA